MRIAKTPILSIIFLLTAWCAYSQKAQHGTKTYHTRSHYNYNATTVKGKKAKIICPIFTNSKYPYQGFGFKLGDPFALTYKFYFTKHFSIAADLGKASSGLYNRYYHEKFGEYVAKDTLSSNASLSFLTSKVKYDWVGELKVLYAIDATKIAAGLRFYVGLGVQSKNTKLQYDYLYSNGTLENQFGRFERSRFTLGQTTVAGIEYSYFHIPVSAFMEMELFTDVMTDPGWMRVQGGVGLRYVF